jgi:hypothetical protein
MLGYSGNSGQSGFSGFSGTTFTSPATLAIVTNATTPVLNPGSIVNNFRLAMPSGATTITLNAPTSGMIDGQIMIVEIDQNSTGAGLVTLSGFVFGSAFASYTLTATANAVDLLGFYYNGNLNQWFVVSLAQGF